MAQQNRPGNSDSNFMDQKIDKRFVLLAVPYALFVMAAAFTEVVFGMIFFVKATDMIAYGYVYGEFPTWLYYAAAVLPMFAVMLIVVLTIWFLMELPWRLQNWQHRTTRRIRKAWRMNLRPRRAWKYYLRGNVPAYIIYALLYRSERKGKEA